MVIYILIFGLAVICSVLLLWYFDPLEREGFEGDSFWLILDRVNKQDPTTLAALAKVSDPDPNDSNDLMPLKFSKYISMYAMSQYGTDISGARNALFNKYDDLQNGLSKNVYTRLPEGVDPKANSCANLDEARSKYTLQYNKLISSMKDLNNSATKMGLFRDENMAYQTTNTAACTGNPSPACISLASQEAPVYSLLSKYDNVNTVLTSTGFIDISNNIGTVNTTYRLLGCEGAPILFSPTDTGTIDTEALLSKLNQMSPYYVSPDTLQYITNSILSSSGTDISLMTDAEKLSNIRKVINTIKTLTGTS